MDGNTGPLHRPQFLRRWVDATEQCLRIEAEREGLYGHGTLTGDGREFLVHRFLQTILPPAIHIGRGRVIDSYDSISSQIDLVLYDPRVPCLQGAGGTLYFAEGVIATIEVKSRLTTTTLDECLKNCDSVAKLDPCVTVEHLDRYWLNLTETRGFTDDEAEDYVRYRLAPKTYVWAYASDLSAESIARQVNDWYEAQPKPRTPWAANLPVLVASGNAVGIRADDWLLLDAGEAQARAVQEYGGKATPLMGFWPTKRQFGWLALRLWYDLRSRLASSHAVIGCEYTLDRYLPFDEYSDEDIHPQKGHNLFWH